MDYKKLGENIKKRRKSLKITQETLADEVDLSLGYISQIETAGRVPSLSTIVKIAEQLNTSVDLLIDSSKNRYVLTEEIAEFLNDLTPEQLQIARNVLKEMFPRS